MRFNKKIITSFLMIISTISSAMELSKSSQEFKKPQSQPIDIKRSPDNASSSYSIPSLTSMWTSAKNTVTNFISDEAAFKKLGWPTSDDIAQEELRNTLAMYTRVNESLQTGVTYDDFKKDYNSINNRQYYCQRVLEVLSDHPHNVELALHCLQHHRPAMHFFDLSRFLAFVQFEQKKAQNAGIKFAQLTIPIEGNVFLNDFFQQTVSLKDKEKEEEEKKRKEEEEKKKEDEQKRIEEERKKKEDDEKKQREEAERIKKEEEARLVELARQAQLKKEHEEQ